MDGSPVAALSPDGQAQQVVDAGVELVTDPAKGAPALVLVLDGDGVGQAPVDLIRRAGKGRALLLHTITDRDHIVEGLIVKLVKRLRAVDGGSMPNSCSMRTVMGWTSAGWLPALHTAT